MCRREGWRFVEPTENEFPVCSTGGGGNRRCDLEVRDSFPQVLEGGFLGAAGRKQPEKGRGPLSLADNPPLKRTEDLFSFDSCGGDGAPAMHNMPQGPWPGWKGDREV